jgi:hypothetical protein
MHTANIAAFAGVGFLAIGTIFSVSDLSLSRTSFELMIGPVLWIVGWGKAHIKPCANGGWLGPAEQLAMWFLY